MVKSSWSQFFVQQDVPRNSFTTQDDDVVALSVLEKKKKLFRNSLPTQDEDIVTLSVLERRKDRNKKGGIMDRCVHYCYSNSNTDDDLSVDSNSNKKNTYLPNQDDDTVPSSVLERRKERLNKQKVMDRCMIYCYSSDEDNVDRTTFSTCSTKKPTKGEL